MELSPTVLLGIQHGAGITTAHPTSPTVFMPCREQGEQGSTDVEEKIYAWPAPVKRSISITTHSP